MSLHLFFLFAALHEADVTPDLPHVTRRQAFRRCRRIVCAVTPDSRLPLHTIYTQER
jgi:hypothetical protein